MKYLLKNIYLPKETDFARIKEAVESASGVKGIIKSAYLYKRSVDGRKKPNVIFCCSVVAESDLPKEKFFNLFKKYSPEIYFEIPYTVPNVKSEKRPLVVGFGPAGMFAALTLARAGLNPIVIERGGDVESRTAAVENFKKSGVPDFSSNIQFGEGGAGTFSDGKLNTGIKDIRCREVLKNFVKFGAGEEILYDAKPHIGTDILKNVVKNLRGEVISLGGEIRFLTKLKAIEKENGSISAVVVEKGEDEYKIECSDLLLCIGHSARDTFEYLYSIGVPMTSKPFAVGARIEHPQELIDISQYGDKTLTCYFGAADYKLSCHLEDGRGVYTFCMCPGGYVVNATSEQGAVVTNGMSESRRDGKNANSALLVGIDSRDFGPGVLDGMYLQRKIEQAAFNMSNSYKTVSQTVGDFLKGKRGGKSETLTPTVEPETYYGDLNEILPEYVTSAMKKGLAEFGRKIKGFDDKNALLTGPETRSSSPVRILRDENYHSEIKGLYPVGEGAGYAGGIMSAAVDGIRTAEKVIEKYNN